MDVVQPSIFSAAVSYFGRGRPFPAGVYRVAYSGGVFAYAYESNGWSVNDPFTPGRGFYIVPNGVDAKKVFAPGNAVAFASPGSAQRDSLGLSVDVRLPMGGTLGMYLEDDYEYNVRGPWGGPAFALVGKVAGIEPLVMGDANFTDVGDAGDGVAWRVVVYFNNPISEVVPLLGKFRLFAEGGGVEIYPDAVYVSGGNAVYVEKYGSPGNPEPAVLMNVEAGCIVDDAGQLNVAVTGKEAGVP